MKKWQLVGTTVLGASVLLGRKWLGVMVRDVSGELKVTDHPQ